MKILGIETSCDETAAALLEVADYNSHKTKKSQISNLKFQILGNVVLSQVNIHKKYGGVVPEVAARKHVETISPVIAEALNGQKPDLIAVTRGPGLITSLQVGLQTAKTLSYVWDVPLVGVNHLEAHLWSYLLNQDTSHKLPARLVVVAGGQDTLFPAIGLIISGGHTEMILVKGPGTYRLIGRTRDDAAGEAFDKVAKMLNLGYPGGPVIAHFAKKGNSSRINFPRPMMESGDFDFSFSGLKTAVKYQLNDMVPTGNFSQAFINDVCASFQQAVIDVLVGKTIKAAVKHKAKSVILGGGVSANEMLIADFQSSIFNLGLAFYYPEKWLTGDNAAMIALTGYFKQKSARKNNWRKLIAEANLSIV